MRKCLQYCFMHPGVDVVVHGGDTWQSEIQM